MFDWKKFGIALLYPHIAVIIFLFPIAVAFLVISLIYFEAESILAILSYLLSFYVLLVICFRMPTIFQFFKTFKRENKYAKKYFNDVQLRINISLYGTLIWNVAFAIFQLVLGFYHKSFWFYAMFAYYIMLGIMRFFLVNYTRRYKANEETKKMEVVLENCVGCGRCIGACNFDAIQFAQDAAVKELNCRMAEYAKAVVDGRPHFHISLVMDISPYCDCHAGNDVAILPDLGMFASYDPLALDQACVDACLKQEPRPNTVLTDNMEKEGFHDHHDHFINTTPESEYKSCLEHAEKIGLGTKSYELHYVK